MSRHYGGWAPYVTVEERRRKAERTMAKLRKGGHPVAPVTISGRVIATTFWGRAWCDNMESYHDYETRLPRGRTYVRNGSVVDLQVAPGRVTAMVSGSELYTVTVTVKETAKPQWRAICRDCADSIDSLVELLRGRLSKGVMERLCRQDCGLFPRPCDIRFSCSCPDHAAMCKHVAAVLYGVGARLDHKPELLFRLRAVDESDLVAGIDTALPLSKTGPAAGRVLETNDISALFGLDMAAAQESAAGKPSGKLARRRASPIGDVVAAMATAVGPVTAAPKPVLTARLTAKPKRTVIAKRSPIKPAVPQQEPSARATLAKLPDPKRAATMKGASRLDAPKRATAIVEVRGKRQKSIKTPEQASRLRRVKAASVATLQAFDVPARGRGGRTNAKDMAVTVREPKQKPVKWW